MKFVITGASSFIGKALIKELANIGHDCIAVIRPGSIAKLGAINSSVKVLELDMFDYCNLGHLVKNVDCLVNLSWLGTRGLDRMDTDMQRRSYEYTISAIKSLIDCGCKIIITSGSQAEYGPLKGYIKETDTPIPNTEYGKYKLKLYEEALELCSINEIKLIEPRFFSLYGPNDAENTMIMSIMRKMLRNEPCNLTQAIQKWDFLYIKDAINGLIDLVQKNVESGIYNFASGDIRMLKDYIEEMKSVLRSNSALNYGVLPYPKTGMVSIMANIEKLRSIGWYAKIPFKVGILNIKANLTQ